MKTLFDILMLPATAFSRMVRGYLSMSLPARAAWAVAAFQVLIVTLAVVAMFTVGGSHLFRAWWSPGKGIVLLVLMVLVPVLVYQAARLWFQEDVARWPDIEAAWWAARAEMDRQQIDLRSTPLFLVLGCDGNEGERNVMQECPIPLLVFGSPSGASPLHVYAGVDGIYVCLSTAGQICSVAGKLREGVEPAISRSEQDTASDRLASVCQCLATARQPVAAINGVVVTVPIVATVSAEGYSAVGAAVGEDLTLVTKRTGLRAPVVVVAGAIEKLPGFDVFMEQLPPAARAQRVGQAIKPNTPLTHGLPALVARYAAGGLTDTVAQQLLDRRAVAQPSFNRSLCELLVAVRLDVLPRLEAVLNGLCNGGSGAVDGPLFAGAWLASAPSQGQRRGFIKGLFEYVATLQGELEWTPAKRGADRGRTRAAGVLFVLNVALALAAAAITVGRWWR